MLSHMGCVAVPEKTLNKAFRDERLTAEEQRMFEAHPQVGTDLIAGIPRMGWVGEIIAYQHKRFDGRGPPLKGKRGTDIPLAARMLKLVGDFDALVSSGQYESKAAQRLTRRPGWYDPQLLEALVELVEEDSATAKAAALPAGRLIEGMVLEQDVETRQGVLVISRGSIVTESMLVRLRNWAEMDQIDEPIRVRLPQGEEDEEDEEWADW